MRLSAATLALVAAMACGSASANGSATIFLDGNRFLQAGSVTNHSGPGVYLTQVQYQIGFASAGDAVWQLNSSTGSHFGFIKDNWYTVEVLTGLHIAPGASFSFGGLDIDLITSMNPVTVSNTLIDDIGTSLSHASILLSFSDHTFGGVQLNKTGWTVSQNLKVAASVPEPQTYALTGMGLALAGFVARRRRQS